MPGAIIGKNAPGLWAEESRLGYLAPEDMAPGVMVDMAAVAFREQGGFSCWGTISGKPARRTHPHWRRVLGHDLPRDT